MLQRVLYLNITRQCNIDCRRCYLTKAHRQSSARMPFHYIDVLKHPYYQEADEVLVIIQGGEATILGKDYLRVLCQEIQDILPAAKMTAVVNLFNLPDWFIDISNEFFNSRFETTFALGEKTNLAGSREEYLKRFIKNLKHLVRLDIVCPVNIELNKETWQLGATALADIILETGSPVWEFDVSLDFESFHKLPVYNRYGYPVIPGTISNNQFSSYLIKLYTSQYTRLASIGFKSSAIDQVVHNQMNRAFNVMRESDFITINPDGTVTTNPLFSDLTPTYIGNLEQHKFEDLLRSSKRIRRITYERQRLLSCADCDYLDQCGGGPSHIIMDDESGECAGMYKLWKTIGSAELEVVL